MKFFQYLYRGLSVLVFSLLLISFLAPFVHPEQFIVPSFFGILFPIIWALGLVLLLFSLVFDRFSFLIMASVMLLSLFFIPRHYSISNNKELFEEENIRLMSFNVQVGRVIFDRSGENGDSNLKTFEGLLNNNIDILCLQEMNPKVSEWFSEDNTFPNSFQAAHKGTFIASKYELIDFGEIDFGTKRNSCIWVDIASPNGPIRVYNAHLQSNKITEDTERAIDESRRYSSDVFYSIVSILDKYSKHAVIRADQAKRIKEHASAVNHPVVIAGDLNETPMSFVYQILAKDMEDSFRAGKGSSATFPRDNGLLRIDYVFASKKIQTYNFEVLRNISLSDHLPIVTTFGISTHANESSSDLAQ